MHRIEYGVDTARQVAAFWDFYDAVGLFPAYAANFVRESVFHPRRFYRHLRAFSAGRGEVREMLSEACASARSEEERALFAALLRKEDAI